jgi:hypothetical protein
MDRQCKRRGEGQGPNSWKARPEEGIDPVLTACHVTTALQAIVSRNVGRFGAIAKVDFLDRSRFVMSFRKKLFSMVGCLLGDPILYWAQRREDTFKQNHSERFAKI